MSQTEARRETFRKWFKEPISLLIKQKHTGFSLMMIVLPLLERLLRGRCHLKDGALTEPFYSELLKVFPTLEDVKGARAFWQSFRHGILHQASFSLKRAGGGADFSGVIGFQDLSGASIALHRSGDPEHLVCMVDPVAFARAAVAEVENDLETFESAEPIKHPIAVVQRLTSDVFSFCIPLRNVAVEE